MSLLTADEDRELARRMCYREFPNDVSGWIKAFHEWQVFGEGKVRAIVAKVADVDVDSNSIEDAVQDAIYAAFKRVAAGRYIYQGYTFSAYVIRIAVNAFRDMCHEETDKISLEGLVEQGLELGETDAALNRAAARIDLMSILENLTERERLIVQYYALDDMSYIEIASKLNMSEAAVRRAKSRAIKRLSNLLK